MSEFHLKGLASRKSINIGAAIRTQYLSNKNYTRVIASEFNMITPEYEMKFGQVSPRRSKYDFGSMDKIVEFAMQNELKLRGHALVWQKQLPNWFKYGKFSRKESIEIMRDHIQTVMERYKGVISEWDVVNEAVWYTGTLRKGVWLRRIGPEYVELAFRFAHEVDPKAILFYNEWGADILNRCSDAIYAMLKKLLKKGVPVHGIGLQMHQLENEPLNPTSVEKNINRFKRLDLRVSITEMDVSIRKPVTKRKLAHQGEIYGDALKTALKTKCESFVMWGVSDANSWIPEYYKQYDAPLIFDKRYKPKLAYRKLVAVLQE